MKDSFSVSGFRSCPNSRLLGMVPVALIALLSLSSCQLPPDGWWNQPVAYSNEELWMKPHLTWSVDTSSGNVPPGLSQSALLAEVDVCFQHWQQSGVFTFEPTSSPDADIVIRFTNPPDGQFDGPLGKMSKGFYPWSPQRGQIYLDPGERWTTAQASVFGNPLSDWLPHQIAHVLGLRDTPGSSRHLSTAGPQGEPDEWALYELRRLYAPTTAGAE